VGRPHVAQALLEAGHVQTISEAFDRFISRNGPAYVERVKFTPEQSIELIHESGGVAVLAHPLEGEHDVLHLVEGLVASGLDGMECYYYREYGPGRQEELVAIARKHGIVPTGGSDFHGFVMSGLTSASNAPGTVDIPPECVHELLERRARRGSATR
jgi:predicted metal-dependent phosphoesterase TrpH